MTGLHMDVLTHIARRGLEATNNVSDDKNIIQGLPMWASIILGATVLFFTFIIFSIRYTLWDILPALAAIETPQTTVIVKEEKPKLVDALAEENIDEEVLVVNHKPITAKIRTAIKHLQQRGGPRARWRGIGIFAVYRTCHGLMTMIVQKVVIHTMQLDRSGFSGEYAARTIASVIASIITADLAMTWTHTVISEPSSKPWYKRVPSRKAWKTVCLPTAVFDVAARLPFIVGAYVAFLTGLTSLSDFPETDKHWIAGKAFICLVLGLIAFFGITIPALVALIRVQASMLPEEDESIVPFDRTFGGRVIPQLLGGTGAISYLDAWRTFDKPARKRMLKLVVKNIMIEISFHLLFSFTMLCEVIAILGPEKIRSLINNQPI